MAVLAGQLEEMRIGARGDATRIRLCALREAAEVNARLLDATDPRADEVRDRMLDALEDAPSTGSAPSGRARSPERRRRRWRSRPRGAFRWPAARWPAWPRRVSVDIGPFADFSQLVRFEDAANAIGAHRRHLDQALLGWSSPDRRGAERAGRPAPRARGELRPRVQGPVADRRRDRPRRRGLSARMRGRRRLRACPDRVAEDRDDLLGLAGDGERGAVDLLERVVVLGRVQGDQRRPERRRLAGVEGRVPLLVLVAEPDDDHVGLAQQRARCGAR